MQLSVFLPSHAVAGRSECEAGRYSNGRFVHIIAARKVLFSVYMYHFFLFSLLLLFCFFIFLLCECNYLCIGVNGFILLYHC